MPGYFRRLLKVLKPTILLTVLMTRSENTPASTPIYLELSSLLGAGNLTNAKPNETDRMDQLKELHLGWARISLYPQYYYGNGKPLSTNLDPVMLQLYQRHVSPMILFEYYGSYTQRGQLIGNYDKWYSIGRAYAERYGPGGKWAQEQGVNNWGVRVFSAFNEPDVENSISFDDYKEALEGLADGVHSIDKSLRVIPGGFSSQNAFDSWTLQGYGTAIAPLLNSGKLDGLDLHTYYDVQYAPLIGTYANSAQFTFDRIKNALGITRDIAFYSTEFNVKKRSSTSVEMNEESAAKQFFTAIWDHVGVVSSSGKRPATVFAMPWSLFQTPEQSSWYGIGSSSTSMHDDWPMRMKVLQMVAEEARGTYFLSMDPKGTGEYTLAGSGKKLWVWQNLKGWTNRTGSVYQVYDIPGISTEIRIYRWNGLWRTLAVNGHKQMTISGLDPGETYMFVAE